jgi:two-component system, NarL family, response regulator
MLRRAAGWCHQSKVGDSVGRPPSPLGVPEGRVAARPSSNSSSTVSRRTPIRVAIVDDHPVVRFGLAAIISLQPDMVVVGEAGSGEDACAMCAARPIDVVLMDLRLPRLSGVEAIRTIRRTRPEIHFIVLTTYDGDEDIRRALDAGAQAYLLKAMSDAEVPTTIRKVYSGGRVIPEPVSKALAERRPHSELSSREIEVLELIANGFSNKEIGSALGITEATVKWHVTIILSRLDVGDRTEAIVAALQRGIIHLP